MNKLTVSEIWIYPVKSLGGIRVHTAKVLPKGLAYDRRWMLIDSHNKFMTQRIYPEMALFKLSYDSGDFFIRHSGQSIHLPFSSGNNTLSAEIWNDRAEVHEVSRQHSAWFSKILGMDCRLVSFPENNSRPVDPVFSINNNHVSLADAYPLLVIGQSSLDDLNRRLEEPLPINRFRPNIVFSGGEPYEEDNWKNFRIGQNRFAAVKSCSRCILTTVNQDTGKKGMEPLATLSAYRMRDNKVYFGQNLIPLDHTEIMEGNEITLDS
ncbi:MAG: MOSC domain-containing protein [Bacteroidota bacterium]|nr:MOSC domain-containing protein [Bacteroidota bacterium]